MGRLHTILRILVPVLTLCASAQTLGPVRPPATPLVAHDPYFSIWSMADRLNAENTRHWTGKPNSIAALLRVDGKTYRVMGRDPQRLPALEQTHLDVTPTRTVYGFSGAGIQLELTFFTPALPDDLEVLSRPLTYIEWSVSSTDSAGHSVSLYFDAGSDLVVNTADQPALAARYQLDGLPVLRLGSREQAVLAKHGDDLRIDWGYLYLAADKGDGVTEAAMDRNQARAAFESAGRLPDSDDLTTRPNPGLAMSIDFGRAGAAAVTRYLMLAYDDLYAIEYFQRRERAWWRPERRRGERSGEIRPPGPRYPPGTLQAFRRGTGLRSAQCRGGSLRPSCRAGIPADAGSAQAGCGRGRHGAVFPERELQQWMHRDGGRNLSERPVHLAFQPGAAEGAASTGNRLCRMGRDGLFRLRRTIWAPIRRPTGRCMAAASAPKQNQMPVEESGNMLILMAALARVEGNADFAEKYWPQLTKWAEYLKEKGLDPENQLSHG